MRASIIMEGESMYGDRLSTGTIRLRSARSEQCIRACRGGGSDPLMKSRKEDRAMQSRRDSMLMWQYPPWFCLRVARADGMGGLLLE